VPAPSPITPPAAVAETQHYAFAFELTGTRNENMLCPLDQHVCRGRWDKKFLIGQTPDERFSELPTIPGLVFVINTKKREVRRFDPLILPANEKLLKIAVRTMVAIQGTQYTPERGRLWRDCSPDFLKSFVWWWWKLNGCRRATIIKGLYPKTLEDVRAMPGSVMGESYNSSAVAVREVPNDRLIWRPPSEDDYANRDPEHVDELPDPFIDIPTDPGAYLDRPKAVSFTQESIGRRSAADVLMGEGALLAGSVGDTGDDEPDVATRL
jgi:hypothetical protein